MFPEHELLERFLRGEGELEPVARAMSFEGGMLSFKAPPYTAEEQPVFDRLIALADRIEAIESAERLVGLPTLTLQAIDLWEPPDDPRNFCLSVAVILQGSDGERAYRKLMRVYVCTPLWLADRARDYGWTWTPAPLVITEWNPAKIREAVETRVQAGGDFTWARFVDRMSHCMENEG
jgi:hypothetical protein